MSEQQCIQCTWDGVRLVKLCKHHQEIDELHKRLAAAEAALNLSTDERQTAEVRCEELTERLAAAEAPLAGTPRTADGVAITDGTQLFRYVGDDLVTMQVKLCYVIPEDDNGLCAGATTWHFCEWYSSDEAAKGGRE